MAYISLVLVLIHWFSFIDFYCFSFICFKCVSVDDISIVVCCHFVLWEDIPFLLTLCIVNQRCVYFFNILPSIAVNIGTNPVVVIRSFNRASVKGSRPLFSNIDSHNLFPVTFKLSPSQFFLGFPSDYGP